MAETPIITDGTSDFSQGVDSLKTATAQSPTNPNGLTKSQLAKLVNGTMRDGGLSPRDGFQFRGVIVGLSSLPYLLGSTHQGKVPYVPTSGNPYEIYVIGGHIIKVDPTFVAAPIDLSEVFGFSFISTTTKAYFCKGSKFLVIQSGNYNPLTNGGELPIFWDGASLTRSNGITGITTRGGFVAQEYNLTLPVWTAPAAGDSLIFPGVVWPGNLYDKVLITDTASSNICTAAISNINPLTIQTDTQISSSSNAAGTYDFTIGYWKNAASMVGASTGPGVQFTTAATITSAQQLNEFAPREWTINFSTSYYYPGNVGDSIYIEVSSTVYGPYMVQKVSSGKMQIEAGTPNIAPGLGVASILPIILNYTQQVFYVPGVGNNVSIPLPTNAPDTYFGSIGDVVTITNGGDNYGTYIVTGYGGIQSWQTGTGLTLRQTIAGNMSQQLPFQFDFTIVSTPTGSGTNVNQIPSAGAMIYFMGRIWYGSGAVANAGDIVGGPSGTLENNFQDSVLYVTENPLVIGGDGFAMPSGSDNITAFAIPQMINASLGQGLLNIATANAIFALQVPVTRADWIAANAANAPQVFVVQQSNGFANDWSCVGVNGDIWFQSNAPDIRSLLTAVRYFQQWGNVDISSNEDYILSQVNPALLLWASGFYFNNRLWMTSLPTQTPFGVVHNAIIPIDLSPISTLEQQNPPNWEGNYEGLQIFQLTTATFSGQQRAFASVLSANISGQIEVWENVVNSVGESTGQNTFPIKWQGTFPGFTWDKEFEMKELLSGELWLDQIQGVVTCLVEYSPDGSSCWYPWYKFSVCNATDSSQLPIPEGYPLIEFSQAVRKPITLPIPPEANDDQNNRPASIGYEFQPRITFTGQCRLRGMRFHARVVKRALYEGLQT